MISKGMGFIPQHAEPARACVELDKNKKWESFQVLRKLLSQERFDVAVSFQAPWWVSLALWIARVPVRAGVRSQWHSFLFLNKTLRQKRSQALKHEADYNAELLCHALDLAPVAAPILKMHPKKSIAEVRSAPAGSAPYAVVHPGMFGSARNWPQKNYVEFIRAASKSLRIVITGTKSDEPWLTEIKAAFAQDPHVTWLVDQLKTDELMPVLQNAKFVLAPSTGVAHIAAALGSDVIALFPRRPVQQSPQRWAPRGPRVRVVTPPAESAPSEDLSAITVLSVLDVAGLPL